MSENFGKATYVTGRHRNPVLVYTSRTDRTKVYEFIKANEFKTPGLVSWKCASCSKVKNGYRNLRAELKRKIPLILVDNDIIKEDPEKPLNAEHFCSAKEAVDVVLNRAKFEFVHRHGNDSASSSRIRETIQHFAREAASTTPVPLNIKEKKLVQKTLDANCLPLLHGVNKRRRRALLKQALDEETETEMMVANCAPIQHETSRRRQAAIQRPVAELEREELEKNHYTAKIESPRKRQRRTALPKESGPLPAALYVRPLPPNQIYYETDATHLPPSSHGLQFYDNYDGQHQMEYYVEGLQEAHLVPHDEELILADEQDVAYDIELR